MTRPVYLVIVILLVIISIGIVGWSFFGLGTTPVQKTQQANKQTTQSAQDKDFSRVPVSINNRAVKFAQVFYTFTGIITEIKNDPKGLVLLTDIKGSQIPTFIVGQNTKVNLLINGNKIPGPSSALAPNQKVDVRISYGVKKKAWNDVEFVNIITGAIPTPTSP